MKQKFWLWFMAMFLMIGQAMADNRLAARFAEAIEESGKYALTEMRPTARFNSVSLQRIRESDISEGGNVKARVATYWTTAFTAKSRTTVIDVWLSVKNGQIYLTRYKLYSDDHNVPITNPQDQRVSVYLSNIGSSRRDDF